MELFGCCLGVWNCRIFCKVRHGYADCWMWEHRADRKEAEGCCIERATASEYIHNQMSKQVTNRVT